MIDLVTCKNEEDSIKNKGASDHNIIHQFLRCSRAANSIIGDGTLTKYKIIQVFIVVFHICKNEEDQFKIESTRVVTIDLPL